MFKKNPNRPQIIIPLKKVHNGFKVVNNESFNPFGFKRITRAVFRCNYDRIQLIYIRVIMPTIKVILEI